MVWEALDVSSFCKIGGDEGREPKPEIANRALIARSMSCLFLQILSCFKIWEVQLLGCFHERLAIIVFNMI